MTFFNAIRTACKPSWPSLAFFAPPAFGKPVQHHVTTGTNTAQQSCKNVHNHGTPWLPNAKDLTSSSFGFSSLEDFPWIQFTKVFTIVLISASCASTVSQP